MGPEHSPGEKKKASSKEVWPSVCMGAGVGVIGRGQSMKTSGFLPPAAGRWVNWGTQDGEVRGALGLEGGQGVSLDMWIEDPMALQKEVSAGSRVQRRTPRAEVK